MSRFFEAVEKTIPVKVKTKLSPAGLKKWGLREIHLRDYQLKGVWWLTQCLKTLDGCILGDEMGLGKTCQVISLLLYARRCLHMDGPFLVLCPLSVLEVWKNHLNDLSPDQHVLVYRGEKTDRFVLQQKMDDKSEYILLTNFEMLRIDSPVFKRWKWHILVVDEAQIIKNDDSKLHQILKECTFGFKLLVTGTPMQNNLQELYSLLSFIQPSVFPPDAVTEFVTAYENVQTDELIADELRQVLRPFLLRRVKEEVEKNLPKKQNRVLFHGLSPLQKTLYKAIIDKNREVFENKGKQVQFQNTLMQLRKCVCHPYLFEGVEPEPFKLGEHLVEASGKLSVLDIMLTHMKEGGHRVLLFSQMTRMLDIVQDYMTLRGWSYERLDGSVREQERHFGINNFNQNDVFIFLLSTKAGGVGLNLTAADTVIFLDSDFNPQNDLQAESRAHRIGQTRPVRVFRLVGRYTVEDIMYCKSKLKLELANTVIEKGQYNLQENKESHYDLKGSELIYSVSKLMSSDDDEENEEENEEEKKKKEEKKKEKEKEQVLKAMGKTENEQWVIGDDDDVLPHEEESDEDEQRRRDNLYLQSMASKQQQEDKEKAEMETTENEGRVLRSKNRVGKYMFSETLHSTPRQKRPLTESEQEVRRQKKEEAAVKRAKLEEEKKRQQQEQKRKKKMAWWASCGYTSLCLPSADSEGEDEDEDEEDIMSLSADSEDTDIRYVLGDVTHPQADREDVIIVHCVDDSGHWGRGGLFTALELRSDEVKKQYELAGDMEDLELGSVLLFPIDDKQARLSGRDYLALIVAQRRSKANNLSPIYLTALDEGLKKIYRAAKQKKASVHLPRIGHTTKSFNWYGTERLIRKHLASQGVPTSIYYYQRTASHSTTAIPSTSSTAITPLSPVSPSSSYSLSPSGPSEEQTETPEVSNTSQHSGEAFGLSDFMKGVCVFFYNVGATERKKLARYLITYDGDEEDIMSSQVTHIVAEVESSVEIQELQEMSQQYPQAILVKTQWLQSCFANQRKVSANKYIHVFE